MLENERYPNPGNDLMTSSETLTFDLLYINEFRPLNEV